MDGFRSSFNHREKADSHEQDDFVHHKRLCDLVQKPFPQTLPVGSSVMPDSFLAYRTLLRKGCVTHIMELITSPYAPGPLQVIHDVLNEISALKEELRHTLQRSITSLSEDSGIGSDNSTFEMKCRERSKFYEDLKCSEKAVNVVENEASLSIRRDAPYHGEENAFVQDELAERAVSLERLESAMSRSVDLRIVLQRVGFSVRDVVQAHDTIGDRESDLDLQKTIQEVERFASRILDNDEQNDEMLPSMILRARNCVEVQHSPNSFSGGLLLTTGVQGRRYTSYDIAFLLSWRLPINVYAELLHGILELSSYLGTHLVAVRALEKLVDLSTRVAFREERKKLNDDSSTDNAIHDIDPLGSIKKVEALAPRGTLNAAMDISKEDEFSIDDVVAVVDAELQAEFVGVVAQDHICAISSCQRVKDFKTAYSLYRRLSQHGQGWKGEISGPSSSSSLRQGFLLTIDELSQAFTALAHCTHSASHFEELRTLLTEDEASRSIPVSVPLYTALIYAVSRATEVPDRMSIALAFYRRLRDGLLVPSVDTYAALMACCASTREPTHAFAFYHEARQIYGVEHFSPKLYTNLLLSYSNAGFGADARRTLDVLVEAGAPLTCSAFHAVLSGAVTLREAEEVVEMMVNQYHILPTPHTYAFLVHAAMKHPAGVQTALKLFDLHEEATASLLRLTPDGASESLRSASNTHTSSSRHVAVSSEPEAVTLEERLLQDYPLYVRSLEHALMRLRLDLHQDSRLLRYLKPLMRIAQRRMNAFTEMAPQAPTFIPAGACPCVAVLAPDVLANIDELVMPFISHYSVIVIPYSALLALQVGQGRRVEGTIPKGYKGDPNGVVLQGSATEHNAMVECRRKRLLKFLKDYQEVIHLVSLEEELMWSRDVRRYGILNTKDLQSKSAAFALNLSRSDIPHCMKLYANNEMLSIILVSTNYTHCGRYVVDLKRGYLSPKSPLCPHSGFEGLCTGLRKVFYHNPRTQPNWTPPTLSIKATTMKRNTPSAGSGVGLKEGSGILKLYKDSMIEPDVNSANLVYDLYCNHLRQYENASYPSEGNKIENIKLSSQYTRGNLVDRENILTLKSRNADKPHVVAEPDQADKMIDAEILMEMMNH
ncbi:unnamed protein product [Phytomonas sp. EM1]|nr:unnamed protein product [Phytomonas sp. EM1]|eukprot:CCW61263.1 unnamed protein product [Phytomonas sp. isolate EM1]